MLDVRSGVNLATLPQYAVWLCHRIQHSGDMPIAAHTDAAKHGNAAALSPSLWFTSLPSKHDNQLPSAKSPRCEEASPCTRDAGMPHHQPRISPKLNVSSLIGDQRRSVHSLHPSRPWRTALFRSRRHLRFEVVNLLARLVECISENGVDGDVDRIDLFRGHPV